MSDFLFALWPGILGGAAGYFFSRQLASRRVIRALLSFGKLKNW